MKLIRDIISEKRQLASRAIQEPEPKPLDNGQVDEALAEEPAYETHPDTAAEDEFAAFFAENDDPFALEIDHVNEPAQKEDRPMQEMQEAPAERPSKLVLGKAFALDIDKDQTRQTETAEDIEGEESADEAYAPSPVEEYGAEHSLKDVFREVNTSPEAPTIAESESDPASDAERQVADLLNMGSANELSQESHEPQLTQREAPVSDSAPTASAAPESVEVPKPAPGRGMSRHGRVKTRLLGFNTSMNDEIDPMKDSNEAKPAAYTKFPVGWLIVVEGEGRGAAFSLFNGVSNIGRGTDQTVCLDFGDNSISRDAHASIAYDPRRQSFFIGHCGKANIVRRNDRPILSTEELAAGDQITIGETVLRFVPLCGPDFSWESAANSAQAHAANG